ncbi:MAG TPA: DNA gyrase subunit A [Bacillota bacterium]|nr:DNA gyrase subunit A [Bacillota bacterium]HOO30971.1 DNA gyrase subunit A [Bacillota bacterium]HPZ14330.1 DNA gyrase subunit A [Bacillota bacterium]HQD81004.1 DNA gyrase subunit A [Bacillota bacterium]
MTELVDGKIVPIDIENEMRKSYLLYSMSVIVGRALPDVRDGLKPIHRRILYAMHGLGLTADKPYRKSATVVGEVMGNYHPHGDAAIYDALVRMAQDFSMRNTLVDGHGNFGSVDGDPPAAMRYTETRMTRLAAHMLADIEKDTVNFVPNFDGSKKEPEVLPARFPQLLVNGSSGIAVGMATNIPPHNLVETIDGTIELIDNPDATIEDLMEHIKGPDFPTGGLILGTQGIREAYHTGRGSIKVRARARIEPMSGGRHRIVVTEIPYQVNKARMIERIAQLARDKRIEGITDLRDESDREGLRIVMELKRDANPNVVLNQLYKHTPMETTFGAIMLVLVDNEPRVLNLKEMLHYYIEHQKEVVTRRTQYDLSKAEERAHILEGLRIALDHIDEIISLIRASRTREIAREGLITKFGLSDRQAQAILEMRLQSLTGLEREKIEQEYEEVCALIAHLREILGNEQLLLGVIKDELIEIRDKFGDPRRSEITQDFSELEIEDLIAAEDVVVTMSNQGYIKRLPINAYKAQRRGGKGVTGMATREEDFVEHLFITNTHDTILFFTNMGKVYSLKGYEIPEAQRHARGTAVVNLIELDPGEAVTALMPVSKFDEDVYVFMATKNGTVKKTELSAFANIRRSGIIGISLAPDDELIAVRMTGGDDEILLVTKDGMSIRFRQDNVRAMGRTAAGVRGINLDKGDAVVGMDIARDNADVLIITSAGYGKRTPVVEYRPQNRAGKGLKACRLTNKTGNIVGVKLVREENEMMLTTMAGYVIRFQISDVPRMGRLTQGVKVMSLDDGDQVISIARVSSKGEDDLE